MEQTNIIMSTRKFLFISVIPEKSILGFCSFGLSVSRSVSVVSLNNPQQAKKLVSDRPGLVDFAIGLVIFVLNLPDRQVLFFRKTQITEGL